MIICENFIVLNFPKTGSTFIREMLKKVYKNREKFGFIIELGYKLKIIKIPYTELLLPNFQSPNLQNRDRKGQHGAYCQIPKEFKNRKIITVCRNPYELFLTNYFVKWWHLYFPIEKKLLIEKFPNFPELTINEFIELSKLSVEKKNKVELGVLTVQFIRMYFKSPDEILKKITEEYITSNLYKNDIADNITFLTQENLNVEFVNFLLKNGFNNNETNFILNHDRINNTSINNREQYWTKEAIEYVEYSERFLFRILNDYGFKYKKPNL